MGNVLDSLYTRLILRDVFGKIVPGSALIISLYIAVLSPPSSNLYTAIIAVRAMSASSWVIIMAAGWLTAFAIQALGGWLPEWRFLPYIRYSVAPLDDAFEFQRKLLMFARVATDAEKQIFERATVIKEACGNASLAAFLSAGALLVRYHDPQALLLLAAVFVGAVLLAKMHRDVLKLNTSVLIDALDERTKAVPQPSSMASLEDAELEALQSLDVPLREHAALSSDAFNMVGRTLNSMSERPVTDISPSEKVVTVLLIRLSNDLRCASLLARHGYAIQAVTLVAAIYEAAFTVAYIGSDDERAREWIEHDDPTRSFKDVRSMTKEGLAKLGTPNPDAQASIEYKVYRQLCMGKHSNPLLQQRYGYRLRGNRVFAMNGPDTSEPSLRGAWFALEHGVGLTFVALSSFFLSHLSKAVADELWPQLEDIGARRKKLETLAKERWGTEDPFAGKWRT
jgi:hypothetical protein